MDSKQDQHIEYESPVVRDYGEFKELTAATNTGTHTDVPSGFPVPPISIFS
jgi:hypothetical protein